MFVGVGNFCCVVFTRGVRMIYYTGVAWHGFCGCFVFSAIKMQGKWHDGSGMALEWRNYYIARHLDGTGLFLQKKDDEF